MANNDFNVRLTKWLRREDLLDIIKTLNRHKEPYKIREGVLWEHGRSVKGYAIYIKERRAEERRMKENTDNIDLNMSLDRFMLMFVKQKREGIGIFKAIRITKIF